MYGPTFGELVRSYRQSARMTQAELAEQVGVGREQVSNWERGTRGKWISRQTVECLARALEVHADLLLGAAGFRSACSASADRPSFEDLVASEPTLDAEGKEIILMLYRRLTRSE